MQPHELLRIAHDRTKHLHECAERHRERTLARAARADVQGPRPRFRARVAAALRAVAERLDPAPPGGPPEVHVRRPRPA